MAKVKAERRLTEVLRKLLFRALVDAQDRQLTVPQSRREVAERFGVSEDQVRAIEQEGLDRAWPPL
jgi:hypothetical protein